MGKCGKENGGGERVKEKKGRLGTGNNCAVLRIPLKSP